MTLAEGTILIIYQGDKVIYEEPGFYDIWTFRKNGKIVVSVQNLVTEEYLFQALPIRIMSMKAPYVTIRAEEAS